MEQIIIEIRAAEGGQDSSIILLRNQEMDFHLFD